MNAKKGRCPQLRFKGFTDPWEERKLGEIAKMYQPVTLTGSKLLSQGYPVFGANGYIGFYSKANHIDDQVTISARGEGTGTPNYVKGPVWITGNSMVINIDNSVIDVDKMFLFNNLASHSLKKYVTGGAQPQLTRENLKNIPIVLSHYSEQQKIGAFFQKIDELITLQQRKVEKLKEQKKGYLQKLFPKNGSKFPQLRFPGFADAWEQRKLGEVATFLNGRAYKQDELLDSGKYKVLRVGNFYTNDSWYYSNMELGDKYYVDKGDLVYTWSATFGPHIWSGEKVIYHYHIWKVELSKFLDRNFTLQLLEADKARLLSSTNGSTMIHVTKGDMESKIVSIPNIDEQEQIGSFFKQFDNTITLHQRKLEKLQELRKGYLQKMFC